MGSRSTPAPPAPAAPGAPLLVLDSASPTVSVAVAAAGRLHAERREPIARSSVRLLPMIDEALREAGTTLAELAGLVALAGPGSFTGLRVGMATALGLHQASGVPATSVPTFLALAAWAREAGLGGQPVLAAVDVLRGEWAVQGFAARGNGGEAVWDAEGGAPEPLGEPVRIAAGELIERAAAAGAAIVGFGVAALSALAGPGTAPLGLHEPEALAAAAARELSLRPPAWDAARLTEPLYFRPPATTLPAAR
jgi:tRNA threonylcarbamoyl adenosine modification protein YeaZ